MTPEEKRCNEFKLKIIAQLKDTDSVLYDLLSDGQLNGSRMHNMSNNNVYFYASEFGLCIDFVHNDSYQLLPPKNSVDVLGAASGVDVIFYKGERNGRRDFSSRDDGERLFISVESLEVEELLDFGDDGTTKRIHLAFDCKTYEIRHKDYVFYRDELCSRHETKIYFSLDDLEFGSNKDEVINQWEGLKHLDREDENHFYMPYICKQEDKDIIRNLLSQYVREKSDIYKFISSLVVPPFNKEKGLVRICRKIEEWAENRKIR